ncbi:MAG: OmpA family protein [Firmicutes bacterium]|nr:OmpA family protein [Bacillota bacterium]
MMPSRGRQRRRRPVQDAGGSESWMLTYSDMVTLLLTFFILLFAISIIDIDRFKTMLISIQSSFFGNTGIFEHIEPKSSEHDGDNDISDNTLIDLGGVMLGKVREAEELQSKVELFLEHNELEGAVDVRLEERGVVMELPEQILFNQVSAELRPQAKIFLKDLAVLFKEIEHGIVIEGHTCSLPLNTARYPSNWELSVARSVGVTRYLVETQGLDPRRFVATGYGEFQPIATNETPEGRAKNRRVTIVISLQNNS